MQETKRVQYVSKIISRKMFEWLQLKLEKGEHIMYSNYAKSG